MSNGRIVLVTGRDAIADVVLSAAAALGSPVEVVKPTESSAGLFPARGDPPDQLQLIGEDAAAGLVRAGVAPATGRRLLVGFDAAALPQWSVPLGAQVIVLPGGLATLSSVLADDRGAAAPVVCVVGGSGGVGASSLAVGLALAGRRRGSVALVDLDPCGGGLDLLLGAEKVPGWRWPRLAGARGEVSELGRFLPLVDGLTLLSMGRGEGGSPSPESTRAVLRSLSRHHDLVVVDAGRGHGESAGVALRGSRSTLLVAASTVRSAAATRAVRDALGIEASLAVSRLQGGSLHADEVASIVGVPLVGVVPRDAAMTSASERGDPPGVSGRGRWARAATSLLDRLCGGSDER